jgi:hypothetical protein
MLDDMPLENSIGPDQHEPAELETQPIRRSLTFDRASKTVGASSMVSQHQDAAIDNRLSSLEALRDKLRRINERAQDLTRSTASGNDDGQTPQPIQQVAPATDIGTAWQPRTHLADSTSSVSSLALSDLSDLTAASPSRGGASNHVETRMQHVTTRSESSARDQLGFGHLPQPSSPEDELLDVTQDDSKRNDPRYDDVTLTSSGVGASLPSTPMHGGPTRPKLPLESPMSKSVAALQSLQASSQSRLQQQLQQHHTEMAAVTSSVDWVSGTRETRDYPEEVEDNDEGDSFDDNDDNDDDDRFDQGGDFDGFDEGDADDLLADEVIFAHVTRRGDIPSLHAAPRLAEVHLDDASWTPPRRSTTAVADTSSTSPVPTAVDNTQDVWTPLRMAKTGVATEDDERAAEVRPRLSATMLTPRSTKVGQSLSSLIVRLFLLAPFTFPSLLQLERELQGTRQRLRLLELQREAEIAQEEQDLRRSQAVSNICCHRLGV